MKKLEKMTEKYDVCNENIYASGGEYPNQEGFGWTNGVFMAMTANDNKQSIIYLATMPHL